MSVWRVVPLWEGREGERGSTSDFIQMWNAFTDSPTDTVDTVLDHMASAENVYVGRQYPTNATSWCFSVKATNQTGPSCWLVTARYSSKTSLQQQPANDPVKIEWDEEDYQRPIAFDRNGKAVLNSTGDPFSEAVMVEDSTRTCVVNFKVAANPSYFRQYRKAINNAPVSLDGETIAAKHCRVKRIRLSEWKRRGSYAYRDGTIVYEVRDPDDGDWELYFLDKGKRRKPTQAEIDDVDNNITADSRIRIQNKGTNTFVTDDVLLDGLGQPLDNPSLNNAVQIEVPYYRLKTFAGNLPAMYIV